MSRNRIVGSFKAFQVMLVVKNLYANAGDSGSIPGYGRFPGVGNRNLFQYSCMENFIDRNPGRYSPQGHKELTTILNTHIHT